MVDERKDIKFPLWRKKVDGSFIQHRLTVIPDWVKEGIFDVRNIFVESSRKHPNSKVRIEFIHPDRKRTKHLGWVTTTYFRGKWAEKRKPVMRFGFDEDLGLILQKTFVMSHMRDLERRMRDCKPSEIEKEIPFYEFLDIEWDKNNRTFVLKAHYVQTPVYTHVFSHLQSKRVLEKIEEDIEDKKGDRIVKGDWKPRSMMRNEIKTENVIYTLLDTKNKEIYVGEAKNLANRFSQKRHEIPEWDYYRVDQLPDSFDNKMRLTLERMIIRSMASLLESDSNVESMKISRYLLKNKRIDK